MNIIKKLSLVLISIVIVLSGTTVLAADIGLVWDQNTDTAVCLDGSRPEDCIAGYNIYHSTVAGGPYTWLDENLGVDNTEWWWDSVQEGIDFYFVVTAFNETRESGYSNEVCAYVEPGKTYAINCGDAYPPPPIVDITATPTTVLPDESFTLAWASTNADSAIIDNGIGVVAVNGSILIIQAATTTYTITAENGEGTVSASVTVTSVFPPTVDITAAPAAIQLGESSVLTWSSTNTASATIDSGIGGVNVNSSVEVSPTETTTYTITATGPDGVTTDSVTVTVTYPQPSVNISASPTIIMAGDTATLTWGSTDATSCEIDNGIGTVNLSNSITVLPTVTTTYTITAIGLGGVTTDSIRVTVTYPPPLPPDNLTLTVSANPETIQLGESSTLTWSSADADSVVIDQDVGEVDVSGSTEVSPTKTTTYTVTAANTDEVRTAAATVTVVHPKPGEDDDHNSSGGGCFIATAAYGSLMERHVQILCEFRDQSLLKYKIGKKIVNFYYKTSPPIADYLRKHPIQRKAVRYALIPVTGLAYLTLHVHPAILLLGFSFILIGLLYGVKRIFQMLSFSTRIKMGETDYENLRIV